MVSVKEADRDDKSYPWLILPMARFDTARGGGRSDCSDRGGRWNGAACDVLLVVTELCAAVLLGKEGGFVTGDTGAVLSQGAPPLWSDFNAPAGCDAASGWAPVRWAPAKWDGEAWQLPEGYRPEVTVRLAGDPVLVAGVLTGGTMGLGAARLPHAQAAARGALWSGFLLVVASGRLLLARNRARAAVARRKKFEMPSVR